MADRKEQATVMVKLTEKEALTLVKALRTSDRIPINDTTKSLHNRLEKDFRTMRLINQANAKGWK